MYALIINGIMLDKKVSDAILPNIKQVVSKDYVIKDWKKFDYLTVEIPFSYLVYLILAQLIVCGGWVAFSLLNEEDKDSSVPFKRVFYPSRSPYRSYRPFNHY